MTMRSLYYFLLRLHPAEFHERFGGEMLCIYDEAASDLGWICLAADAVLSLGRQWLSRIQFWKWAVATLGGLISLFCGFGGFITWRVIWEALRTAF